MKLQHWRGSQAENALKAAPVLEFVNLATRTRLPITPKPVYVFPEMRPRLLARPAA